MLSHDEIIKPSKKSSLALSGTNRNLFHLLRENERVDKTAQRSDSDENALFIQAHIYKEKPRRRGRKWSASETDRQRRAYIGEHKGKKEADADLSLFLSTEHMCVRSLARTLAAPSVGI